MNILPYELATTNDLLTSRAGLTCIAQLMETINFSGLVNQYFPLPQSNRSFRPAVFVNAMMLMLHEGEGCLDDLRHIRTDRALRKLLGLKHVPESDSMGNWLRRMGHQGVDAITEINRSIIKLALKHRRNITLDIDATLSASKHQEAQWTYKKCKGYMPMVGHIAETGQVLSTDFRAGNVSPATDNFGFIKQCEAALPEGVSLKNLRIDAAGYQVSIVDDCIARNIGFAIRARMSKSLKQLIKQQIEADWQPLLSRHGKTITDEATCRLVHSMERSEHAFTVIVQRKLISGQQSLALEADDPSQEMAQHGGYIYRAIATNKTEMTNSEIVHWYNQRADHSENRIKELKNDFSANRMPCKQFAANALYFSLCSLAYNLFALMRALLPVRWEKSRVKTIRWRLYAMAGKVVMHGRKVYLKLQAAHQVMLSEVLSLLAQLAPIP